MSFSIEILSHSVDRTLEIGRAVGGLLEVGDVLALVGPLGSGKTHLVKGIAVGVGAGSERQVNSPTFVLVNEYEGRLRLFHLDAYRLGGVGELDGLGFDEMCAGRGVVVVEWADRVAEAFGPEALWIELTVTAETERRLVLRTESATLGRRLGEAGLEDSQA